MIQLEPVERHTDARGDLIKAWPSGVSGEVYAVQLLPDHPRGNHWHAHGGEWFMTLEGVAWLVAEDPATKQRAVVRLDTHRAYVPAGIAHALYCEAPALVLAIAEVHHQAEQTTSFPLRPPTAAERAR